MCGTCVGGVRAHHSTRSFHSPKNTCRFVIRMAAKEETLPLQTFERFVESHWHSSSTVTRRPSALNHRPRPPSNERGPRREKLVNGIGLGTGCSGGLVLLVWMVRTVPNWGLGWVVLFLTVCTFFAFVAPRFFIHNFGRKATNALSNFAQKKQLEVDQGFKGADVWIRARGKLNGQKIYLALFSRQVTGVHYSFAACPIPRDPLELQLEPKRSRLSRPSSESVEVPRPRLEKRVSISATESVEGLDHARLLSLFDAQTEQAILDLIQADIVLRIRTGRLEAYINSIDFSEFDLGIWTDWLRTVQLGITQTIETPLPERLLSLVLSERGDFQEACFDALRLHFAKTEECQQADEAMRHQAGGQLSLATNDGGDLSIVADGGELSVAAQEADSKSR